MLLLRISMANWRPSVIFTYSPPVVKQVVSAKLHSNRRTGGGKYVVVVLGVDEVNFIVIKSSVETAVFDIVIKVNSVVEAVVLSSIVEVDCVAEAVTPDTIVEVYCVVEAVVLSSIVEATCVVVLSSIVEVDCVVDDVVPSPVIGVGSIIDTDVLSSIIRVESAAVVIEMNTTTKTKIKFYNSSDFVLSLTSDSA